MSKITEALLKMPTSAVLLLILSTVCTIGLVAIAVYTGNPVIFASGFIVFIFTILFFIGVSWFRVKDTGDSEVKDWKNS